MQATYFKIQKANQARSNTILVFSFSLSCYRWLGNVDYLLYISFLSFD